MKKISFYSFFLTLLLLFGVTNAMADVVSITPSATKIQGDGSNETHSDINYYNAEATEWTINQSEISGCAFKNTHKTWGGSYILLAKFDCSAQLQGKIVKKATLKYTSVCTVSGRNSDVKLAKIGTNWEPSTATWASTNTGEIMQAEEITAAKTNVKTTKNITVDVTELLSNDEDKVVAFALYTATGREQKISNYSLEVEYVDASQTATVTVKYVDTAGNEIKESTSRDEIIWQPVTVNDNEKEPIYYEGTKYLYSEDNSKNLIVKEDDSTVLTITFRKAYTAMLNVTYMCDKTELDSKSNNFVEADNNSCSWNYSFPAYILKGGKYYGAGEVSQYGENGTFTDGQTINKTVNYQREDNIVFFEEWETQKLSSTYYPITYNDFYFSDGMGRAIMNTSSTMSLSFNVAAKGKYKIEMPYKNNNNKSRKHIISIDDAPIGGEVEVASGATGKFEEEVTLDAGPHSIKIKCVKNLTAVFDYAVVRKTADLAIVSDAGFATFSPSSNVVVPGNVKVYTVTVNAEQTGVELNPVSAGSVIAAGTGYVLEAKDGSYPFAVSNGEVSEIGENALKVSDGSVTVGESDKIFVLAKRKNGSVGFSIVNTGVTIPAGKAYLQLSAEAKVSFLSFGDDATAIESVETNNNRGNGEYYTLQGVRTSAPVKGLYIINGKKVVVK